jgi:hypothetical protein
MIDLKDLHKTFGRDIEFLNALLIAEDIQYEHWDIATNELYARRMDIVQIFIKNKISIDDLSPVDVKNSRQALNVFLRASRIKKIKRNKKK